MGKLFRGLLFLVILVIAGLIFAPNFIPADVYKPRVQQAVSEALGREVTMAGDIRFQFFPTVDVVVGDVSIANVPNGKAPAFAQMDEMAVGLDVSALLSGVIGVDRFTLTRPQMIALQNKGVLPARQAIKRMMVLPSTQSPLVIFVLLMEVSVTAHPTVKRCSQTSTSL